MALTFHSKGAQRRIMRCELTRSASLPGLAHPVRDGATKTTEAENDMGGRKAKRR
jgi:hypothetical protein